ncbi:MAG: PAS domain S-box protein, partial [Dehalococcoidia bacterium]
MNLTRLLGSLSKGPNIILLVAFGLGVAYWWLFDPLLRPNTLVDDETGFLEAIAPWASYEAWVRSLATSIIFGIGVLAHLVLRQRKRTEATLRERTEQHRAVVQSASDAIISTDSNGKIISWNPAAETTFGYSEDEAVGLHATLIV